MKLKVAVVGATGAVGQQLLSILESRKFPVGELIPFASSRSVGKKIAFAGQGFECRALQKGCFEGMDIAFFDASDAISKEWAPEAARAGAWVVDNAATFRMLPEGLLIVPEVNGHLLDQRLASSHRIEGNQRIITGPNCSTAQMVVALKPLRDKFGLKRVVVSTYQSTSGAGAAAMQELRDQTAAVLGGGKAEPKAFVHQIAFNCIPQIGGFKNEGYTSEEEKMIEESRKLLELPNLRITATAVRVPTFSCHAESINVECERNFGLDEVRIALQGQPGLILQDEPSRSFYPMGMVEEGSEIEAGTGRDPVYVGRVRRDASIENGLNFWVVSDNLRKGAALNAVQIGERLVEKAFRR
jgi:aspartate-semialdehyde dehydrogenase